jgi:hypothetical protein
MSQVHSIGAHIPVFPFHHITKVQNQGQFRPTVQDGALPQVELHYKSSEVKTPSLDRQDLTLALQRYLEAPVDFRSRTGNIIDIVR